MERKEPLTVLFYRSESGRQPVREWLLELDKAGRMEIGTGLWRIQSEWPIGMPHVRPFGSGLYEARFHLENRIARIIFTLNGNLIVLLHGFIKKSQKTPAEDLALAQKRRRHYEET